MSVYKDPKADVDARVSDLLERMTLEEKVRQTGMVRSAEIMKSGSVSVRALRERVGRLGAGCLDSPRIESKANAKAVNAVQRYLAQKTRLGIPALVTDETLHGHMSPGATVFPQAIALGSTWNPTLAARVAAVAAKEARAVGVNQALGPDLDLARDPRWGRVEETYGEDPYLVSRIGAAYIKAMQGSRRPVDREHIACTAKHYAAHGSPEAGVNIAPVPGGIRDLYTTYLPPFRAAVVEAGTLSVMPAYSEYDGVPAAASKLLLTTVLREEWGFKGYTFSDYGSVHMLHSCHRTAATPAEAGAQALRAGMDLEAPLDYGFGARLLSLVKRGKLPVSLLDQAVSRILRVKFLLGLFENPCAESPSKIARTVRTAAHRRLARKVAQESIILLKNEKGLLPLSTRIKSIAVIGPNAQGAQLGDYSAPGAVGVGPLEGIRKAVSKRTKIRHAPGCTRFDLSCDGFAEAVKAARDSDVAVVFIGGTSHSLGGVGWGSGESAASCGEGYDVTDLAPPGVQADLVRAVHDTGTPLVVVLVNGRPYSIPWMAEHVPAIVEAWYQGEQGGHAIADVLFGKVNPSGKLTVTVPRSAGHVPVFYNHMPSARGYYHVPGAPGKPGRDYVFSHPSPLFEFGHGLSYTTFKYSNLRLSPRAIPPDGKVTVRVDVRNAGKLAGKEVVQLYINDVISSVTTPVKALKRFKKIRLAPGQKKTVSFTLKPNDLALLDEDYQWTVEPGDFEVMIGGLKKTFTVK